MRRQRDERDTGAGASSPAARVAPLRLEALPSEGGAIQPVRSSVTVKTARVQEVPKDELAFACARRG